MPSHAVTCRHMSLHVVTCRYMPSHAVTCRHMPLHGFEPGGHHGSALTSTCCTRQACTWSIAGTVGRRCRSQRRHPPWSSWLATRGAPQAAARRAWCHGREVAPPASGTPERAVRGARGALGEGRVAALWWGCGAGRLHDRVRASFWEASGRLSMRGSRGQQGGTHARQQRSVLSARAWGATLPA